jgi:hypothetical protein
MECYTLQLLSLASAGPDDTHAAKAATNDDQEPLQGTSNREAMSVVQRAELGMAACGRGKTLTPKS